MYESHFGLACRPFAAAPHPDWYFAGESVEAARETLTRVVERAEGPALVVEYSATTVVEAGFKARVDGAGNLHLLPPSAGAGGARKAKQRAPRSPG